MSFAGDISQPGRRHTEGAEVGVALHADVRRQENLGQLEGEGRALQATHGRVRIIERGCHLVGQETFSRPQKPSYPANQI